MEKEMEIIDQSEVQEVAEFENLNARANEKHEKIVYEESRSAQIIRQAEEYAKKETAKAEKAKARRKAYTVKSISSVCALLVLSGAVLVAGKDEMIHPTIWMPTALVCLCLACLRFGTWFGRMTKK